MRHAKASEEELIVTKEAQGAKRRCTMRRRAKRS